MKLHKTKKKPMLYSKYPTQRISQTDRHLIFEHRSLRVMVIVRTKLPSLCWVKVVVRSNLSLRVMVEASSVATGTGLGRLQTVVQSNWSVSETRALSVNRQTISSSVYSRIGIDWIRDWQRGQCSEWPCASNTRNKQL